MGRQDTLRSTNLACVQSACIRPYLPSKTEGRFLPGRSGRAIPCLKDQSTTGPKMMQKRAAQSELTAQPRRASGATRRLAQGTDPWVITYVLTLLSMIASASSSEYISNNFRYGRYLPLLFLATISWKCIGESICWSRQTKCFMATLWLLVTWSTLSALWSVDPALTLLKAGTLTLLSLTIHGCLKHRWRSEVRILRDLSAAYIVVTLTCVASLILYFGGEQSAIGQDGRLRGVLNNPNMMGLLSAIAFPIGFSVVQRIGALVFVVGTSAMLTTLILSASRTSLIALALTMCYLVWSGGWKARLKWGGISIFTGSLVAFVASGGLPLFTQAAHARSDFSFLSGMFARTGALDALNARPEFWHMAVQVWRGNSIGGTGFGTVEAVLSDAYGAGEFRMPNLSIHNGFLQLLMETGAVGAVLCIVVLVVALKAGLHGSTRLVVRGVAASGLCGIIIQLGESPLFGIGQPFPYIFWIVIAASIRVRDLSREAACVQLRNAPRLLQRQRSGN